MRFQGMSRAGTIQPLVEVDWWLVAYRQFESRCSSRLAFSAEFLTAFHGCAAYLAPGIVMGLSHKYGCRQGFGIEVFNSASFCFSLADLKGLTSDSPLPPWKPFPFVLKTLNLGRKYEA